MFTCNLKNLIAVSTALTMTTALLTSTSYAGDMRMFHMGGMRDGGDHGGFGGGMGTGMAVGLGMALIGEAIAQQHDRVIWSGTASSNGHTETAIGYDAGMDFSKRPGKRQKVRVVRTRDGKPLKHGSSSGSTTDPETGITTTSTSNGDGSRTVTQVNAQGQAISSQIVR